MTNPDDAHAPTHEEHTGHGGHHVLSRTDLLRTFGALCALTVLTVGLALAERAALLPLGGLSVPVALTIAGAKATFVALFFMGLKYDNRTNALAFVGGIVFLLVFLSFTYLDTGFRDTFEPMSAVPADVLRAEDVAALSRDSLYQEAADPATLVIAPDTLLFGAPPPMPGSTAPAAGGAVAPPAPAGAAAGSAPAAGATN
jgi:cytochrome c oxidase subunit 4